MAAAPTEPKVTANGTMLMHAMPYLVGQYQPAAPPAPPPPPSAPDAAAGAPESARVRRALDEMSMVIDIQSMSRKLASASEDELARYVDVLRRSEGLPEAAPQLPVQQQAPTQGQPPYGYAPHAQYPQQSYAPAHQAAPPYGQSGAQPAAWAPPAAAWAPPGSAAPPPWVHPSQPPAPAAAPPAQADKATNRPAKRAGAATAMFAVMFIVTLLGVGAVTYVALRGGDLAANGAAAAQRAPL
jgi:hypothetical protein